MHPDDAPPPEFDDVPRPRPERRFIIGAAIVFGANLVCLLMLAARSESSSNLRGYFDVAIFACMLGVAAFAIVRFMFQYPFTLLDLLIMVSTMALGMKFAIDAARWIHAGWISGQYREVLNKAADGPGAVLYAELCMLIGCVLMGGAALGLRNCKLLKIEAPMHRAVVLVFGMMGVLAPLGLATIPFYLLHRLLIEKQTTTDSLSWIAALMLCFVTTLANASFSIRTLAHTTTNATQERKWREK